MHGAAPVCESEQRHGNFWLAKSPWRAQPPAVATEETTASGLAEIARKIHIVRNRRVLLDSDLAAVYGVTTQAFNQAVQRNLDRFPEDFLLALTNQDVASLR
jgi:hypothetical protein